MCSEFQESDCYIELKETLKTCLRDRNLFASRSFAFWCPQRALYELSKRKTSFLYTRKLRKWKPSDCNIRLGVQISIGQWYQDRCRLSVWRSSDPCPLSTHRPAFQTSHDHTDVCLLMEESLLVRSSGIRINKFDLSDPPPPHTHSRSAQHLLVNSTRIKIQELRLHANRRWPVSKSGPRPTLVDFYDRTTTGIFIFVQMLILIPRQ